MTRTPSRTTMRTLTALATLTTCIALAATLCGRGN